VVAHDGASTTTTMATEETTVVDDGASISYGGPWCMVADIRQCPVVGSTNF